MAKRKFSGLPRSGSNKAITTIHAKEGFNVDIAAYVDRLKRDLDHNQPHNTVRTVFFLHSGLSNTNVEHELFHYLFKSKTLYVDDLLGTPMPEVPPGAEKLLGWVVKSDRLELVLDDLEENFQKRVRRNGELAAREWYQSQVRRTFFHFLIAWAPRIAGFVYLLRKLFTL
jgi:hypothetical protein